MLIAHKPVCIPGIRGPLFSRWVIPAVAAIFAIGNADATTFCVHGVFELSTDLTDISTGGTANGSDHMMHLVSGTFLTSGAAFNYHDESGSTFTFDGGWDSTCTTQDPAPGATRLDGGNATVALHMETNGTINARHLTIQGGKNDGSAGAGAQVYLSDAAAVLVFENNQVVSNHTTYGTGGLAVYGVGGTAHINANLFAGNTAPNAGAFSTGMNSGSVYLTNNTVVGNSSSAVDSMTIALANGGASGVVSNNIVYANTAYYDFYLSANNAWQFAHNDFHNIKGVAFPSGNIDVDPKFAGIDDYHLISTSPLLRAGTLVPPGGLPATDLEGNPRSVAGCVDIGAYEDIDVIFANGSD
jgi:hypothetical protein